MNFFLEIEPPTVTAQEHKVAVINGKPRIYEPARLREAKKIFRNALRPHRPEAPIEGPVMLTVSWYFMTKSHKNHAWKTSRPDTDNLQKLLKDCMTDECFWVDDAQVCIEIVSKRWTRVLPGIRIDVKGINDEQM